MEQQLTALFGRGRIEAQFGIWMVLVRKREHGEDRVGGFLVGKEALPRVRPQGEAL